VEVSSTKVGIDSDKSWIKNFFEEIVFNLRGVDTSLDFSAVILLLKRQNIGKSIKVRQKNAVIPPCWLTAYF
jgi:hypothetical protein